MEDYNIPTLYQGGYSSLKPNYGLFTGYTGEVSKLGVSTDPRTANILKEFSEKMAPGQKVIELSLIDLGTPMDTITKQQLEEVRRLSELTGVEVTVHGPITDASGVTNRGQLFSDQQREIVERKIIQAIERSHELNPNGNIPVTFHTSNELPGPHWNIIKNGKGKNEEIIEQLPVVNQDTGQVTGVKRQIRNRPLMFNEKGEPISAEKGKLSGVHEELDILNRSEWDRQLQQVIIPKEHADSIIAETFPLIQDNYEKLIKAEISVSDLPPEQQPFFMRFRDAQEEMKNIQAHLHGAFENAFKSVRNEEEKKTLIKLSENYNQNFLKAGANPLAQSRVIQNFMENLRHLQPELYKPADEYALEKTAKTYGNAAFESWKKFGYKKEKDTTPIVLIENPPAGGGLSRGGDVRDVVEGAQKRFIELAKSEGISESQAKEQAQKLIGVTWDVGHINQLRRYGFSGENIIEEAGKVKHLVKHIHLSDNFGMDNIEMPMGMGNVDFKEVMKKLGKNAEQARKIVEAAHWWQFQQSNPMGVTYEALSSPLYSSGIGPNWNQVAGFQQGYFGGYGTTFPQINYETFGGGFSTLPTELGGQRQTGRGSRMSGTPME